MMLPLYRAVTVAGWPAIRCYLAWRRRRGKEDSARFSERFGVASRPRPPGRLVWMHAASVGESLSLLPLVERLVASGVAVLVTTGTVTSARMMQERLPEGAFHQFVPVDRVDFVRHFFDHWRPDLVLWLESEFWPNLISEPKARQIPMVLLNGRVSDRSFAAWARAPGLIRALLSGFDLCLGQTEEDARRLKALGARDAVSRGNLKFAAPPLPVDGTALGRLTDTLGARPRWLAASTHPGEETIAGRVHLSLKRTHPGLLTIVAPRHPERGADIARELSEMGLNVARRGAGEWPRASDDVYIADTMGELGLFFRAAEVVFMGKSLLAAGGQNPLEPARLDCAILFGPHMENFAEVAVHLRDGGGARRVADEAALAQAVGDLLSDAGVRARMAAAAKATAMTEAGVLDAVMAALQPYLQETPRARV